ncbi:MAG TPA: ABC transporter substrate-binding protein [Acidimicrobiia bacterium]|jgi:alpha-glucoside transport system substrate-binding protein
MNRLRGLFALVAVLALVIAACGGDGGDGATTTAGGGDGTAAGGEGNAADAQFALFGAPTGVEGDALAGFVDVYNGEVGSDITYTGVAEFEEQLRIQVDGGNPPEVAFTPQPASICAYADEGALASLEDMGFDIAEMEANHSKYWMDLGLCEDGNHYGIPWFPNFKSIVFYHEPTFTANGYEIPETYEDLVALSQQIVDDGLTPWCFGFESGTASGWPGTDWIEDIYVRQNGSEAYAQWYNHEIPFNDPTVATAFDTLGEILFAEGFVLGGPEGAASTFFEDSPGPLFNDPDPGCLMLKQGSFVSNFFTQAPGYEEGEESEIKVFAFPTIDGNTGAMGGGDTIIVFDGSPENVAVIKDWITPDWQCTLASASGGGVAPYGGHGVAGVERLPGHKDVDPACYETESGQTFATAVTEALAANSFVFDGSDLMPPEVGQRTFWDGVISWTRGAPTQETIDTIEASWPAS